MLISNTTAKYVGDLSNLLPLPLIAYAWHRPASKQL